MQAKHSQGEKKPEHDYFFLLVKIQGQLCEFTNAKEISNNHNPSLQSTTQTTVPVQSQKKKNYRKKNDTRN